MPSDPATPADAAAAHVTAGHSIIQKFEDRAKEIAATYPVLKFLLPAIAACLHDLLQHLAATPSTPAIVKALEPAADAAVVAIHDELEPGLPLVAPAASTGSPTP